MESPGCGQPPAEVQYPPSAAEGSNGRVNHFSLTSSSEAGQRWLLLSKGPDFISSFPLPFLGPSVTTRVHSTAHSPLQMEAPCLWQSFRNVSACVWGLNLCCLWWWWSRVTSEALTDVCGIWAGRDLNTLQRSLIWLRFPSQDTPNMLFPGHNIYADCKALWCEQNRSVKVFYISIWGGGEEEKVEEDYCQTFPFLLSVCMCLDLPFPVCLFQAGSAPVFVFLLPPLPQTLSLHSLHTSLYALNVGRPRCRSLSQGREKKREKECRSSVSSSFLHSDAEQEMETITSFSAPPHHLFFLSVERAAFPCSSQAPI